MNAALGRGLCLGFGFCLVISGFPLSWWQDQCEDGSAVAANPTFLLGKNPKSFTVCSKGCFREHLICNKLCFTGKVFGFDLKDQELANPLLPVTDSFYCFIICIV